MTQTAPVSVLNQRMPLPPSISLGAASPPLPRFETDWASLHSSGWLSPLRPEQVQRRWPYMYGMPYGIPLAADPYFHLLPHYPRRKRTPAGMGQAAAGIALATHGAPLAGAGAILLGLTPIPVIGPFAGVAGAAVELLAAVGIGRGCGQTCIKASQYANQAGDLMAQNLNTYLALPAPRAQSLQTHALAVFDALWQGLVQACSDPSLNDAGTRCITDREQGACKWTASQGGWKHNADGTWTYVPWGPAGSGSACWNYFIGMRDPIVQDPAVVPDAQSAQSSQLTQQQAGSAGAGTGVTAATGSNTGLLLAGALIVFALMSGRSN